MEKIITNISKYKYFHTIVLLILSVAIALIVPLFELKTNNSFVTYAILILCTLWGLIYLLYQPRDIMRLIILSIVGMFTFAFCLVPIYNVFCQITGLNGKIDLSVVAAAANVKVDLDRTVIVEFDVNYNEGMPWEFRPKHKTVVVHPGEIVRTAYYAVNPTKTTMRAQAIPSISPSQGSRYFKKVECFCFNSQKLGPKESAHLPLQFFVDPDLPKDIKRLTLSYTLFDITGNKELKDYNPHKKSS